MRPSFDEATFSRTVTVRCRTRDGRLVREFPLRAGLNLWVFLRKHGLPIGAACSGVGVCAACHVEVTPPEAVSPAGEFERGSLSRNGKDPARQRLACLCRVVGDVEVVADYW